MHVYFWLTDMMGLFEEILFSKSNSSTSLYTYRVPYKMEKGPCFVEENLGPFSTGRAPSRKSKIKFLLNSMCNRFLFFINR